METIKYSDRFMEWLRELGYTHCFYLGGGNVMHLLESASYRFKCIPFVHEVAAGIAADYFNEVAENDERAFVLVTAGPALTNVVTAIAGAWTESRELLVIGGQAKVSDLSRGKYRNLGFQEIDGASLCESITKKSVTIDKPISFEELSELTNLSKSPRKGPVLIEFCLDVSAMPTPKEVLPSSKNPSTSNEVLTVTDFEMSEVVKMLSNSHRPLLLLGGGVDRRAFEELRSAFEAVGIPIATTFNGADRIGVDYKYYAGRPNWYGSRWANIVNQQADLVIAVGTRLGLLQVGYNWEEYVPNGKVIQVDVDQSELDKPFPRIDLGLLCDANDFLRRLLAEVETRQISEGIREWQDFIIDVRSELAVPDSANKASEGYIELHNFLFELYSNLKSDDQIVPCSSGGTYTGTMQVLLNKTGQKIVTSHALASMGYGLSGAIGVALANKTRRTILVEGDGGFAQNLQELGTLKANQLNIKVFISDNRGYASIRTTQKTYFNNHYVGCDEDTGLGLPDWQQLVKAYEIPVMEVNPQNEFGQEFLQLLNSDGPAVFIVKLDPDQLYFPKIGSRINKSGVMASSPIHLMDPPLNQDQASKFLKYV
jgi:acetolactate synthase-1/2/3 large subunit